MDGAELPELSSFLTMPPEIKLAVARECPRAGVLALSVTHTAWSAIAQDTLLAHVALDFWADKDSARQAKTTEFLKMLCEHPAKALRVRALSVNFRYTSVKDPVPVKDDDWRLFMDVLKLARNLRHLRLPYVNPLGLLDEVLDMIRDKTLRLRSLDLARGLYEAGYIDFDHPFSSTLETALVAQDPNLFAISMDMDANVNPYMLGRFTPDCSEFSSAFGYSVEDRDNYNSLSFWVSNHLSQYWEIYFDRIFVALPFLFADPVEDITAVSVYLDPEDFTLHAPVFTRLVAKHLPRVVDITFGIVDVGSDAEHPPVLGWSAISAAIAPFGGRLTAVRFKCYNRKVHSQMSPWSFRLRGLLDGMERMNPGLCSATFPSADAWKNDDGSWTVFPERHPWE